LLQRFLHFGVRAICRATNPLAPPIGVELVSKEMQPTGVVWVRAQIADVEYCFVVHNYAIDIVPLDDNCLAAHFPKIFPQVFGLQRRPPILDESRRFWIWAIKGAL
jgi:hypothetical protein